MTLVLTLCFAINLYASSKIVVHVKDQWKQTKEFTKDQWKQTKENAEETKMAFKELKKDVLAVLVSIEESAPVQQIEADMVLIKDGAKDFGIKVVLPVAKTPFVVGKAAKDALVSLYKKLDEMSTPVVEVQEGN